MCGMSVLADKSPHRFSNLHGLHTPWQRHLPRSGIHYNDNSKHASIFNLLGPDCDLINYTDLHLTETYLKISLRQRTLYFPHLQAPFRRSYGYLD